MRTGKYDAWILAIVFFVVVIAGYFLAEPGRRSEIKISTTYNPDPLGVKAFYTLLGERLGYNVDRLKRPYTRMPNETRVLFVVQPISKTVDDLPEILNSKRYYITAAEREALIRWIKRGGTVVFLADNLAGVPASFGSDQQIGQGFVYAFSSRHPITNAGMRDYRNAMKLLRIIEKHASKQDLILFDEYHHGISESRSLWSYVGRQVKVAMILIIASLIVLCHTYGRRFGAVRNLPKSDFVRPSYEFVEAVGRLYRRAKATNLAAKIFCTTFRKELCAKYGISPDVPYSSIIDSLNSDLNSAILQRIERLLAECESWTKTAGQKPSEQELLHIAREVCNLEKELGLDRT